MITSLEPKVVANAKYTINETCELLGIHRNTLRSYVKAGYIKPILTKRSIGNQRFKGVEILRFWNLFV